ncbi:unnamed protein product [Prorocentrum cordatum]|uniref:FYVE-type domain-containing protein n=1 Tax=Prorocentrum cordatum TaxID=2364126 RepID=A0ABN9QLN8_9DINO|nr:unnamed protein product [Polarella glacialis]
MLLGGNGNFRVFVNDDSLDLDGACCGGDATARRRLYEGVAAQRYRHQLAQRSGRPSPPPLAQAPAAGAEHEVELLGPKGCGAGGARCQQQRHQLTPTPTRAPPAPAAAGRSGPQPPPWAADCDDCMLCRAAFTVLFRRHHCRRCGKCVCGNCAPWSEARPVPEWGLTDPVRHCKECVCLAMLGQLDS